jgi:ketosteroid isomerase-like protein
MSDDAEVEAVVKRFYDGIEAMITGRGLDGIRDTWHHTERVTTGHPSGDWAVGWDELWATWQVFASFGREDRGGGTVRGVRAHVYGDVAYVTCTYVCAPAFGGEAIACTDVLHRDAGEWKLVHHHADKSPKMEAALEKIIAGD